jgi:UbiD family decarboxylase
VGESGFQVAGNLFCSKAAFASYFNISVSEIIPLLARAIKQRVPCPVVEMAPCQEMVVDEPDLDELPILLHCAGDGGNYISAGVVIARHPKYGQNLDFHRCMQFSNNEMAMRVVRWRHFDAYLRELGQVEVCAATAQRAGCRGRRWRRRDELEIANALELLPAVKAKRSTVACTGG